MSRPELEITGDSPAGPTPEEAAAVVAAVEQFLRDRAPVQVAPEPRQAQWTAAGLREGVQRAPDSLPFWA